MFVTPPSLAGMNFVWAKRFGWWEKKAAEQKLGPAPA
jgi:hypothetical protein